MKLAKDALDVGLLTSDPAVVKFFREDLGFAEPEVLPISDVVTQHRFEFRGSILKVNVVESLTLDARSGYASIALAGEEFGEPRIVQGPDEIKVEIVSSEALGGADLGVRLQVPDRKRAESYFENALGWDVVDGRVRVGTTVILLEESPNAPSEVRMPVRGWTYLTVQIFDCDAVTAQVVAAGAVLAAPARTLNDVARFSLVADPFGNQLEISERSSVTGRPLRNASGA